MGARTWGVVRVGRCVEVGERLTAPLPSTSFCDVAGMMVTFHGSGLRSAQEPTKVEEGLVS